MASESLPRAGDPGPDLLLAMLSCQRYISPPAAKSMNATAPRKLNVLQQRMADRAATVHKVAANKAGRRFALILHSRMTGKPCTGTYGVWSESLNYAGHVRGGIARSWGYCQMGLSLEDAEVLFARKIAGKQRP